MTHAIVGLVPSQLEANNIVTALKADGFVDSEISVIFPDSAGLREFEHENSTKAPEGAVAGASAGGVVGGAVGLLAGIGALAVPGVGPLIAAGPIVATLSGVAAGATLGGVAGGLAGMGVPEYEAKMFEGKLKEGNILLAAHCPDKNHEKVAEQVFKANGACDVHQIDEKSAKRN